MEKIQLARVSKLKVNIVKKTDNELKIEVEGAGHSLLNVLQKTLLDDDTIEVAGYHVPHPLIDSGILYVNTKGKQNPEAVIAEATKKVLDLSKDFQKAFKKASKDYKPK
jgi:DNA-directed RNA polymerase subunit L